MSNQKKKPSGCGCANIPISLILVVLGGGYWWFSQYGIPNISQLFSKVQQISLPISTPTPIASTKPNSNPTPSASPSPSATDLEKLEPATQPASPLPAKPKTPWEQKAIRGVYLSRYQITNNASEQTIRERVRYYRSQGINTIIHGVWGNACTMYNSQVMQQTLGYQSCPNEFQDKWLDWLIDEAHKQGMEVHAYFEKGIKIDENSPVFDLAVSRKWIVPGVDKTHPGVDHYVLDVEIPEVADFFKNILVEFVTKYPEIDAVQWDDYLGYHAELPGKVDRTANLTKFVQLLISEMKQANPSVSFDLCHHNPYWAKRYFAADWQKWNVDRVFIQVYNEENFQEELKYVKQTDGIAITERQFHHLENLVNNPEVKSILIFPLDGQPESTVSKLNNLLQ
ncbi:family 10 glycosylhydrolase [Oscillatoria salina]|uniref:family 10 glycosylhydrolase n=1 Tax=Oscillatoria salina TaxID=331517 RepID=UPI001CCD4ACA|nr:family 10 glycosylhydrolase [Oscillatoria salina]MBZ8179818.1 family 10 glycosylhydrolase [Oscillatoria salina IIICB1]